MQTRQNQAVWVVERWPEYFQIESCVELSCVVQNCEVQVDGKLFACYVVQRGSVGSTFKGL